MQHSVSLRKCTTLNILTRNSDMVALEDKSAKGKSFTSRHVNVLSLHDCLGSVANDTFEVAVYVESFRSLTDDLSDLLELALLDSCGQMGQDFSCKFLWRLEAVPGTCKPLFVSKISDLW